MSISQISMFMAQSGPINISLVARSTIEFTISASPYRSTKINSQYRRQDRWKFRRYYVKFRRLFSFSLSLCLSLRDRLVFYFSVRGNFGYFVFLFPFIWVFVPYFLISEVKFKARVVFNLPKMFKKGQPFIICHVFVGVTRAVLNCTAFVSDHCIFI